MPIPTQYTTAQLDAESPWNETATLLIKTTFDYILNYGTGYIATDIVAQASVLAANIGQGELKTSTEEQSVVIASATGTGVVTFSSVGTYGFWPQSKVNATNVHKFQGTNSGSVTTYSTKCYIESLSGTTNVTHYVNFRYVQASPPYKLGGIPNWGKFLWLLRNKNTGVVRRAACADDPPWAHRAKDKGLPKDHPGALALCPHPFFDDNFDPLTEEILLVDQRDKNDPVLLDRPTFEAESVVAQRAQFLAQGIPEAVVLACEAEAIERANAPRRTSKDLVAVTLGEKIAMEERANGNGGFLNWALAQKSITEINSEAPHPDAKWLEPIQSIQGFADTVKVVCCP